MKAHCRDPPFELVPTEQENCSPTEEFLEASEPVISEPVILRTLESYASAAHASAAHTQDDDKLRIDDPTKSAAAAFTSLPAGPAKDVIGSYITSLQSVKETLQSDKETLQITIDGLQRDLQNTQQGFVKSAVYEGDLENFPRAPNRAALIASIIIREQTRSLKKVSAINILKRRDRIQTALLVKGRELKRMSLTISEDTLRLRLVLQAIKQRKRVDKESEDGRVEELSAAERLDEYIAKQRTAKQKRKIKRELLLDVKEAKRLKHHQAMTFIDDEAEEDSES